MRSFTKIIIVVMLVTISLSLGYWLGSEQGAETVSNTPGVTTSQERKILYYRNPMGLPDTSPVPKKDPMGMDYIPVYEEEIQPSNHSTIKISTEKIQKLGVRTEAAVPRQLVRTVRAVATIQADEQKLYTLVTKFEGWIHRLYVNTTGQTVKKGQALMEVYSPDLIAAQHEYLIAMKGLHMVSESDRDVQLEMRRMVESTLQRLRNWDISEVELQRLQQENEVRQYVTLRSKANGVVLEKPSVEGKRFTPGEVLYQIADLSSVWVLADVFEQDLGIIHLGQKATIRIDAYPDKVFNGEVAFIYPMITPETRTAIVRIELPNKQGLLKPAMYARVEFSSFHTDDKVLAIPDSAVLDTGTRRLVLVDVGKGRFEPRTVKLGMRADGYVEVLGGLETGETVVVKANFLIDAESNLQAALSGFGHSSHPATTEDKHPTEDDTVSEAVSSHRHQGKGSIEAIDFAHATVTLAHGPITSLNWPAMLMDFRLSDPSWLRSLKPGQQIVFEITEESAGEYVITHIHPVDAHAAGNQQRE
ncbi:efflux RND transporter periplasmic adaptor subunit [Nitrosomonas sp.]|uniref:efflux RND transporter periplasmic adaptor subunit n=1 Tax=Nitrosomonas sp. TaxID=42353 RepID=UPI00262889D1|nr:efflux RND transporter periplasmic adaptor subunit [Nitrosomonas sp.]MCW5600402.1 efflux RND transporter periplasmic adaptor subunit [Nitrosomonas sp.]